jgi:hypothetical protein
MSGSTVSRPRGPGANAANPEILAVFLAAVSQSCAERVQGVEAAGSDDTGMTETKLLTASLTRRTTLFEVRGVHLSPPIIFAM